jgi:hypothetical protein
MSVELKSAAEWNSIRGVFKAAAESYVAGLEKDAKSEEEEKVNSPRDIRHQPRPHLSCALQSKSKKKSKKAEKATADGAGPIRNARQREAIKQTLNHLGKTLFGKV